VTERPSVLPPQNGGSPMAEPTLDYRMWQRGSEWHWQVMELKLVLTSGVAQSSTAARAAAFRFVLQRQGDHSDT
jgi:hypothetical protein